MRLRLTFLSLVLASSVVAQPVALRQDDRIRLAEIYRLADNVQDMAWEDWSKTPFPILLVTNDHEFLIRHPDPSEDFTPIGYDTLLQSSIFVRDRVNSPGFLAAFPAVGGISTVVIGQPENTNKSSTYWVLAAMHEHFHQLQAAQHGYYERVAALELSNGDESGMWMLNFPFPYEDESTKQALYELRDALINQNVKEPDDLESFLSIKGKLREKLTAADYRYLSFQLWQEGVARYTELRVADLADKYHTPAEEFRSLPDFVDYGIAATTLRSNLDSELRTLDIEAWGRVSFYPLGAAEALLLDRVAPDWRSRYHTEPFYLERYFEQDY